MSMTIQTTIKQQTVITTTLVINHPQNYALLEEQFRLVRYVLPDALFYRKNPTDFGQVHNRLRDQIDYPYKSFQYDKLDGVKKWAVYVLYPRKQEIIELTLPWINNAPLPWREVSFCDLPLHLLLKLLQIRFFRGDETTRFVGQDKCYVYARPGKGDFHYCVEVELKGALTNMEGAPTQEFHIIPHAKRFGKFEPPYQRWRAFFGKRSVGNRFYFIHLKSDALELETVAYASVTFPGKRAQVKFHDPYHLDASKGKIVYDFIQEYLASLRELGIEGHARERTFTLTAPPTEVDLPLQHLNVVGIYDNRLKRSHLLAEYVDLFNGLRPDICFVAAEEIAQAPQGGVLVLLDAKAEDFEVGGMLSNESDPYLALYAEHAQTPKQSLNVNPNDPNALEGRDYLDYPMVQPQDDDLKLKLGVTLSELYLKCAIMRGIERFPLPLLPNDRAFIRRARYGGESFTTALWIEGNRLCFANLGDPTQNEAFYQLLDKWHVDWDEKYEMLLTERRPVEEDGTRKDLTEFDIIVGSDLFVAIEEMEERVLYAYDEIGRRRQEQQSAYSYKQLQLASHYGIVKQEAMLTFDKLSELGLLDGSQKPSKANARQSLAFYRRLQAYDELLEEIAVTHPTLSYQELTSGEWLERIARIFGSKANSEGKYHRRLIAGLYHKREMFLSEKGQDVHLYQGIWHDPTNAFLVGSPTSMNKQGQQRANLIRRFQIMQGAAHFDREEFLLTMGVLFVRHKQYTVVPYYFHLIDLYVENVLQYLPSGAEQI